MAKKLSGSQIQISQFERFLRQRNLKLTQQRYTILEEFLCHDGHFSAEEFYHSLHERNPGIGQATVFRNLKLLAEAGIANEVRFDNRITRYEIAKSGQHHDHFRCTNCGLIIEFSDPELEELQEKIAHRHGLLLTGHRMDLYGLCVNCQNKSDFQEIE